MRTCQQCGLEDPSLVVGSCLACISERKGREAERADIVAWLCAEMSSFNGGWIAGQIERGDAEKWAKLNGKAVRK